LRNLKCVNNNSVSENYNRLQIEWGTRLWKYTRNVQFLERGGCALMKNVAKHPCSAQTGWSKTTPNPHSETFWEIDHPVRSIRSGFAIFS
jgi:hypothetical protein